MSYKDTFIVVAPDCPVSSAVVPAARGGAVPTHVTHYEMVTAEPYRYTHEDLIFAAFVRREGLSDADADVRGAEIRAALFAKPHACLRASALPKRYGWGVHYDAGGRIALYAVVSEAYARLASATGGRVTVLRAMRSRRA